MELLRMKCASLSIYFFVRVRFSYIVFFLLNKKRENYTPREMRKTKEAQRERKHTQHTGLDNKEHDNVLRIFTS
jgi:hypothetical protein